MTSFGRALRIAARLLATAGLLACGEDISAYGAAYISRNSPEQGSQAAVTATFLRAPSRDGEPIGQCWLNSGGGGLMDAGRLVFDVGPRTYGLSYDYDAVAVVPEQLEPGTEITVEGEGAEVPPFVARVVFPEHLANVEMPGRGEPVSLSEPLRVRWRPAASPPPPEVEAATGFCISTGGVAIICAADESDGQVVVPRELLATIWPGDHLLILSRNYYVPVGVGEVYFVASSLFVTRPSFVAEENTIRNGQEEVAISQQGGQR